MSDGWLLLCLGLCVYTFIWVVRCIDMYIHVYAYLAYAFVYMYNHVYICAYGYV